MTGPSAGAIHPAPWGGVHWVRGLGAARLEAGTTGRGMTREALAARWRDTALVDVEQVHGGGVAALLGRPGLLRAALKGCDAMVTAVPALTLIVRTADCLPIFFADAARGVIGLAHAGWRGLAVELPARVVAVFRHTFLCEPEALRVAIGPCIRACCYDVGPEFSPALAPFVRERAGRRTCDLVGAAKAQLLASGVPEARLLDAGECTACHPDRWYSLRREGRGTGRLLSFMRLGR